MERKFKIASIVLLVILILYFLMNQLDRNFNLKVKMKNALGVENETFEKAIYYTKTVLQFALVIAAIIATVFLAFLVAPVSIVLSIILFGVATGGSIGLVFEYLGRTRGVRSASSFVDSSGIDSDSSLQTG